MPSDDASSGHEIEPMTDLECREQSLSGIRDALAALQQVPAAGLDAEKHETITDNIDDLRGLERALQNEVDQMRETDK